MADPGTLPPAPGMQTEHALSVSKYIFTEHMWLLSRACWQALCWHLGTCLRRISQVGLGFLPGMPLRTPEGRQGMSACSIPELFYCSELFLPV